MQRKPRRSSVLLLLLVLAVPDLFAKKSQPVLEWKTGILWASPDPCLDSDILFNRETYLIIADDVVYHVRLGLMGHKPLVTERGAVKYATAQGDFFLQDDDGRVFKLSVMKKELDPGALDRMNNGKRPCQP